MEFRSDDVVKFRVRVLHVVRTQHIHYCSPSKFFAAAAGRAGRCILFVMAWSLFAKDTRTPLPPLAFAIIAVFIVRCSSLSVVHVQRSHYRYDDYLTVECLGLSPPLAAADGGTPIIDFCPWSNFVSFLAA